MDMSINNFNAKKILDQRGVYNMLLFKNSITYFINLKIFRL